MLCDTHTHLNNDQYDEDQQEVIKRAQLAGLEFFINISIDKETINSTLELTKKYSFIFGAVGFHPYHAPEYDEDILRLALNEAKVCAIGETGLDYYRNTVPKDIQQDVFRKHIQLAREASLPLIIHSRDAYEDVLQILGEEKANEIGGVMHCFGGDIEIMQRVLDLNFHIGLGGPVTYKNALLPKEIAKHVPINRLLIETDCPYLSPHPLRGKRNEPQNVSLIAAAIADLKDLTLEELSSSTNKNAKRLFGI